MEIKGINKLPDTMYKCNSFIEFKNNLFKMTQEKNGVKTTTGITEDIKELFTKEDLIIIVNNFKNKNEKKEIIKLLDFKEITFKDVTQIFESKELTEVVKEFNIKVSKKEVEELYSVAEGKDKELLQSLLKMNIIDEKTITEIVLDNIKDERVIDYIRDYNLKLTNEQLNDIITRFEDKNITEENREFINIVERLSKRNDELTSTINYQVISEKYQDLQSYLPIITCHPELQEQILSLSNSEYTAFLACLDSYSDKTQDWTPVVVGILDNIKQYEKLTDNLDAKQVQREGKIELLTKLLAEPNYFNITNIDEYFEKRDMVCETILKNPNSGELEEFPLISEMSEKDRIKFAVLEKNFGLTLEQAQTLINKFGTDIDSIDNLHENAGYYKGIINSLKFIYDDKNIEQIANITFNSDVKTLDANIVEREIKDIYDKDYVSQLYRPMEEDFEREEDGVLIYKAGKSTDGKFLMETHSPGAVYENKTLESGNFYEAWNKPKVKSQAFCTVTSRQDMLIATKTPFLEYGFYDFEEGSLRASGYEDISSEAETPVIFADEDERYCGVDDKINKTRNINENDRSRTKADGTRKQPDYIKFRKSRFIPPQMDQRIWENSKKAAKQFGIPIVIVDQDECTKRENKELQNMLQEFSETKNPELISEIIVKFENNRKGNDFGKKIVNTDFEIDGKSSTITRNSMLLSLIKTIKECDDISVAQSLYEALNIAIEDEVKKMKTPGAKILNEKGIPVVTKKQMTIEEYFSTGRNKETGEYNYISSYQEIQELETILIERKSKEEITFQQIGKETMKNFKNNPRQANEAISTLEHGVTKTQEELREGETQGEE